MRRATPVALALALAAAAVLVWRAPDRTAPAPTGELTLASTWPGSKPVQTPGSLPDGTTYSPQYYLDPKTSMGTALSPDRKRLRLVLRAGDAARELRSLPANASPQYGGFTVAGDDLAWSESTEDSDGTAVTRIWAVNLRDGRPARPLTSDTGDAIFFNSQYDLDISGGRVYWAAAGRTANPVTEVRSVPLSGGAVTVRQVPGAFALSAWPWLVSAGTGQSGPVQLHNLDDDRETTVPAAASDVVTCSPAWCRVLVMSNKSAPSQLDLMRPDGSARRRVAGGSVSSAVIDVAVLDRFEVLSRPPGGGSPATSQDLLLYDLAHERTVLVAAGAGTILCRGGMLSWSTGDNETLTWHTLALSSLR